MEEEARDILNIALSKPPSPSRNLAEAMHEPWAALGGIELPIVVREPMRELPRFDE
jgi:hypothetical protein